jgi:hypothetical protein
MQRDDQNPEPKPPDAVPPKSKLFFAGGFLMAPVCFLGLFYSQSFVWLVCPQALVVMFLRQWQHAPDSLGAADYPDLAVAMLYYPVVGWILSRASRQGGLAGVAVRVGIWHVVAIGLAVGAGWIRNRLWGFR